MYAVRITPEGKNVLQRAMPIAAKVDEALVESLSPEQREQFSAYLQKVVSRQGPREPLKATEGEMRSEART